MLLVVNEASTTLHSLPKMVQPLLENFKDVAPDDLPTILPPDRDIEH